MSKARDFIDGIVPVATEMPDERLVALPVRIEEGVSPGEQRLGYLRCRLAADRQRFGRPAAYPVLLGEAHVEEKLTDAALPGEEPPRPVVDSGQDGHPVFVGFEELRVPGDQEPPQPGLLIEHCVVGLPHEPGCLDGVAYPRLVAVTGHDEESYEPENTATERDDSKARPPVDGSHEATAGSIDRPAIASPVFPRTR